jgi:hypothetical protein
VIGSDATPDDLDTLLLHGMHMIVDEPSRRHAYLEAQELTVCVAGSLEEGNPLLGDWIFDDSSRVGHRRRSSLFSAKTGYSVWP